MTNSHNASNSHKDLRNQFRFEIEQIRGGQNLPRTAIKYFCFPIVLVLVLRLAFALVPSAYRHDFFWGWWDSVHVLVNFGSLILLAITSAILATKVLPTHAFNRHPNLFSLGYGASWGCLGGLWIYVFYLWFSRYLYFNVWLTSSHAGGFRLPSSLPQVEPTHDVILLLAHVGFIVLINSITSWITFRKLRQSSPPLCTNPHP